MLAASYLEGGRLGRYMSHQQAGEIFLSEFDTDLGAVVGAADPEVLLSGTATGY